MLVHQKKINRINRIVNKTTLESIASVDVWKVIAKTINASFIAVCATDKYIKKKSGVQSMS